MTDNAFSYRHGRQLAGLLAERGNKHKFIKPHCPWQNGKVERFNRTLATEWAYRQVFITNDDRTAALPGFLDALTQAARLVDRRERGGERDALRGRLVERDATHDAS